VSHGNKILGLPATAGSSELMIYSRDVRERKKVQVLLSNPYVNLGKR
jgi:hypothetical protein